PVRAAATAQATTRYGVNAISWTRGAIESRPISRTRASAAAPAASGHATTAVHGRGRGWRLSRSQTVRNEPPFLPAQPPATTVTLANPAGRRPRLSVTVLPVTATTPEPVVDTPKRGVIAAAIALAAHAVVVLA